MTAVAKALVKIVGGLPEDKTRAVVDFARFLQQQAGDHEWERIIADRRTYLKLDKFFANTLREGPAESFDHLRL